MIDRSLLVPRFATATVAVIVAVAVAVALALALPGHVAQPRALAPAPASTTCDEVTSLGVCVTPHPDGARIERVSAGSVANRQGWRRGDLIEEIECFEVRAGPELREALAHRAPRIKVVRDGQTVSYRLLKLERPQ